MDYSPPVSSAMGISRQEYWSGLPFPILGDLPDLGIKPTSLECPVLASGSLPLCQLGSPRQRREVGILLTLRRIKCLSQSLRYWVDGIRTVLIFYLFNRCTRVSSCSMWDLVPWPGIKHVPAASGAWSVSPWNTGEVPGLIFLSSTQDPYFFPLGTSSCIISPVVISSFFP